MGSGRSAGLVGSPEQLVHQCLREVISLAAESCKQGLEPLYGAVLLGQQQKPSCPQDWNLGQFGGPATLLVVHQNTDLESDREMDHCTLSRSQRDRSRDRRPFRCRSDLQPALLDGSMDRLGTRKRQVPAALVGYDGGYQNLVEARFENIE